MYLDASFCDHSPEVCQPIFHFNFSHWPSSLQPNWATSLLAVEEQGALDYLSPDEELDKLFLAWLDGRQAALITDIQDR